MAVELIRVEVVYGLPDRQSLIALDVESSCSVESAIRQSDIISIYPEIDLQENKVGIWNKAAKLGDTLKEGDRIEIYRPLIADPKEVRKLRAERAKREGRADKVTGGRPQPNRRQKKEAE
ncbi:RnfH family protein [Corallincola holothuriorum]|uniref:UPF0125 protein DU002_13315 n=1 Tax=Corallincola holothuriorum TaxID=2282215 RepID=A0A368NGC2_9GAMM|nr:RnfH family protein [Corallincola holothuriorum]RCU48765.1 RnfH family protein [Corallincola holothuriorum]